MPTFRHKAVVASPAEGPPVVFSTDSPFLHSVLRESGAADLPPLLNPDGLPLEPSTLYVVEFDVTHDNQAPEENGVPRVVEVDVDNVLWKPLHGVSRHLALVPVTGV